MCGICGLVYKDPDRHVESDTVKRMTARLVHRGPDDHGYYFDRNVGFGHRRLSIVDLAGGHQPMTNADETIWIVYNGEIYNHRDLRRDLETRGYRYRTLSDTETIINTIAADGSAGLHKLRGMFAFALHDRRANSVFIARDRLGIKPLYYVDTPEFFAFASEIKALLELPGICRELNHRALLQVLALKYTCDDTTLFCGIHKLEPGHYLELKDGIVSIVRYWDCGHIQIDPAISEQDAAARLRELLDESINLRLMADVPLGMFLSGGIDSTIIAARMARMVERPIATFSVAFAEREANELEYARLAARHAGADQHEVTMSTEDFFQLLPRMIYHEDEPIAHPSSVALYKVSELAGKHVKVVLTGEGSDELFGGYERYYQTLYNFRADRLLRWVLPASLRRRVIRPMIDALPYKLPYRNKAVRTVMYLDADLESLLLDNYSTFSRAWLKRLLSGSLWQGIDPGTVYAAYFEHYSRSSSDSPLARMLYADVKTYLVELLMKQDQMSMAASIESRVPFLDHKLVEFAFQLPDRMKIKRLDTKRVLRRAFRNDIPQAILTRPKAGFPVPIRRWFANEYHDAARRMILGDDSLCLELFDRSVIEQMFQLHRTGKYNYSDQIWTLLNLEIWHSIFFKGCAPEAIRIRP